MKSIIAKIVFSLSVLVLLSSCAAHTGYMANSASLDKANFSYVAPNISGKASATYIFGFGGLNREALVNEAKQAMLAQHPLKDNQALANLTVNFKISTILIYSSVKCTVTADVVEFK
jgi:hypothetical protein